MRSASGGRGGPRWSRFRIFLEIMFGVAADEDMDMEDAAGRTASPRRTPNLVLTGESGLDWARLFCHSLFIYILMTVVFKLELIMLRTSTH